MNAYLVSLVLPACVLLVPLAAAAVSVETVPVGNPGNPPDTTVRVPDGTSGYGSVAYRYRIGTFEITNSQYAEFLNAKAASDPVSLYNANMGTDVRGGITRTGSSHHFSYAVKADRGNKPVNLVDWYDAIRFANWLNNGQGTGDTETGAYTLGELGDLGIPVNPANIIRNANAVWFLPSENEWYKAAYYDPRTAAQGGPPGDDHYWLYPTASDDAPTIANANSAGDISNPGTNVANYSSGSDWNGQDSNVTTVGSAGPLSESFYGTLDQGGNVWEWSEQLVGTSARIWLGASWNIVGADILGASFRGSAGSGGPGFEDTTNGFRVARIPPIGDVNFDGFVNIFDVNIVSGHWSESGPVGDANKDGIVNIFDINLISANWSTSGGASAVPEPSTIVLAMVGATMLVVCRRRAAFAF